VRAALPAFTGDILQVPPQVSAVKVEGRRAYDLARAGAELDLAPRPLHVERLELVAAPDRDSAVLEMTCGKGGYVRSIARDLGARLGCLGHVAELRRLWSGPFTLDGAVGWDEIEAGGEALAGRLLPVAAALAGVPELACPPHVIERLRNGNSAPLPAPPGLAEGATAWASAGGVPLAIGAWRDGELHPSRVLVLG
jgi:tRNA pseudouridine55 synthase